MKGNKKLLALASAAFLLGACAQETVLTPDEARELDPKSNEISFGVYTSQAANTRASKTGAMTTTTLQASDGGFGVFAYYTGKDTYGQAQRSTYTGETGGTSTSTSLAPNFMYNQKVTYDNTSWTYTPIKYWPNDFADGNVDNKEAQGSTEYGGNVSFFAYAPYNDTRDTDVGITAMSENNHAGDPTITYTLMKEGEVSTVDLLWGTLDGTGEKVTEESSANTNTGVSYISTAAANTYAKAILSNGTSGYTVNADLNKQKVSGKVGFKFKHALASLAGGKVGTGDNFGFKVQLDIDNEGGISGGEREKFATTGATADAWRTIVTIKDITITNDLNGNQSIDGTGEVGLPTSGTLNLATGQWTTTGAATGIVSQKIGTNITGQTAAYNAVLNTKLAENFDDSNTGTTWFAKETGTPKSVADYFKFTLTDGADAKHPGVTKTAMNVYNSETQSPLFVIPGTTPKFKITVDYIVRTYDAALSNKCTEVEQKISKTITFPAFELNKHYSLVMHLGLTGIKFTATVDDWADGHIGAAGGGTGSESDDTYLPINVQ